MEFQTVRDGAKILFQNEWATQSSQGTQWAYEDKEPLALVDPF